MLIPLTGLLFKHLANFPGLRSANWIQYKYEVRNQIKENICVKTAVLVGRGHYPNVGQNSNVLTVLYYSCSGVR